MFVHNLIEHYQKRSWWGNFSNHHVCMCAVCMQILSLYVYMQNFICALAHVLCILSLRPQVIVTDVKLREGKKSRDAEEHIQAGHRGQKPSQLLPCGAVLTIRGAFSSSDQEGRPSGFRGPFLRVTGFHPDIVCLWTLTLALEIPAFKSQQ